MSVVMIVVAQNKTEKDVIDKLSQVFDVQLTGEEYLEELVGVRWYEIELFRAMDYFWNDIEYLSISGQICINKYEQITVKDYTQIIIECRKKGLDKEVSFVNDSVNRVRRKISTWSRVFPAILVIIIIFILTVVLLSCPHYGQ